MGGFAWVTLATNDSYSLGALVLAHSLKQAGTVHQLAVLVTPGVTAAMREKLGSVFNVVREVNILDSRDEANLKLLKRPELGITFTKLHCWRLTQFEKCVFLDADTLVLQNADELFQREELSAAPDVGWPDCFNSGVFVFRPSLDTYEKLIQFALEKGSFDGGDQGLLNLYFSDWAHKDISRHLPFIYNMCSTACYSYLPAFKQFGGNAKIIHFIGTQKPWLQYFNTETRRVQPSGDSAHLEEILQRWWDIFCSLIHPMLSPAMAGLAGAFSQLTLGVARTPEQDAFENVLRKQAWEVGNIDYLGKDSFENIWSKITQTLSTGPQPQAPPVPAPAPAESQSQSAPQEVASSAQPPVSSGDAPTTIIPATETLETKPSDSVTSVVAPADIAQLPQKTDTVAQEVTQVIAEVKAPEPEAPVCPIKPVAQVPEAPVAVAQKPAEVSARAEPVSEPIVCPMPAKEEVSQKVISTETPTPSAQTEAPAKLAEAALAVVAPEVQEALKPAAPVEEIAPVSPALPTEPVADSPLPQSQVESIQKPTSVTEEIPSVPVLPTAASESEVVTAAAPTIPALKPDIASAPTTAPIDTSASSLDPAAPLVTSSQPVSVPPVVSSSEQVAASATTIPTSPAVSAGLDTPAPTASAELITTPSPSLAPDVTKTDDSQVKASTATPGLDISKASAPTEQEKASPATKVTEATPPATPSTPPIEKTKQALTAEATVPPTPPPTGESSVPTPPPRKTEKPKKSAAKSKK